MQWVLWRSGKEIVGHKLHDRGPSTRSLLSPRTRCHGAFVPVVLSSPPFLATPPLAGLHHHVVPRHSLHLGAELPSGQQLTQGFQQGGLVYRLLLVEPRHDHHQQCGLVYRLLQLDPRHDSHQQCGVGWPV